MDVRALTIRQPAAWLVARGLKRVENRTFRVRYRGPLLIHAGCSRDSDGADVRRALRRRGIVVPDPADLAHGAIVGIVDLVDCLPLRSVRHDPFASGPWCWVLANAHAIEPIECRGQLGLWRPPAAIVSALARLDLHP